MCRLADENKIPLLFCFFAERQKPRESNREKQERGLNFFFNFNDLYTSIIREKKREVKSVFCV